VNDDAIVLSEIVEFALSLAPQSKGQEPFGGLPHLQAYKLVRAANLAEMGHMLAASRLVLQPFSKKKNGKLNCISDTARPLLRV
jgi:Sec23-binding domain of Sec16